MNYGVNKFRYELKYYINLYEYSILKNRLKWALNRDVHGDMDNEYRIRSLYFDDVYNTSLFEKQSGVEERKKYRIRFYNMDDFIIRLEKKSKHNQLTDKLSTRITRTDVDKILKGDIQFMIKSGDKLLNELYAEMRNNLYRPVVIVDYTREAYTFPTGNVRITFDKNLKTGISSIDIFNRDIPMVSALSDSLIIMEVKYTGYLPLHIRQLLQVPAGQRMSISKYAICRKFLKINNWEDN